MPEPEWLLFAAQLPATPSSLRVSVWRQLRNAGAASLQNGLWILPRDAENTAFAERLLAYVRGNSASGQILRVQGLDAATTADILARFRADRAQEYAEFLEQCDALLTELAKETDNGKFTYAELEENEQNLERLRKWLAKIQKRDFFRTEESCHAVSALESCCQALRDYTRRVYALAGVTDPSDTDGISAEAGPAHQEEDIEAQ